MGTNASLGDAVAGDATYGAHEANQAEKPRYARES